MTVAAYTGSATRVSRATLTPKSSLQTKASDNDRAADSEYVIYEKPPRWYMKAIWLGVLMNIGIVLNFDEMVLRHWTEEVPTSQAALNDEESTYKLRPLEQRVGAALLATGFGAVVIGGLLVIKYRTVHRLVLHPDQKHILIQSAGHSKGKGRFVKKEDCSLEPGRGTSEIFLRIKGMRGVYFIDLDGAKINDAQGTAWNNRRKLLELWHSLRFIENRRTGYAFHRP